MVICSIGILFGMTVNVILIVAGCVLLLIGLVGGGINSKYLSVRKVEEGKIRFLCGFIGLALIVAGISLELFPGSPPKNATQIATPKNGESVPAAAPSLPPIKPNLSTPQTNPSSKAEASLSGVNVSIDINLGSGSQFGYTRQSEDIELFVNERRVVGVRIDEQHPHRVLKIKLDQEGLKSYRVSSVQTFTRDNPPHDRFVQQVSGQGTIDINDGDKLRVRNSYPVGNISLVDDSSDEN